MRTKSELLSVYYEDMQSLSSIALAANWVQTPACNLLDKSIITAKQIQKQNKDRKTLVIT